MDRITEITLTIDGTIGEGTPILTDDALLVDIEVTIVNPPSTGTLDLSGSGGISESVAVGSLDNATSHTFRNVTVPSTDMTISLTAEFLAFTGCSFTNANAGTAYQTSFTFTDTTGGTGMVGGDGMMQMFMAEDPCSCVGDQVQNTTGTVTTVGSFDETVTVRGPRDLFVKVANNGATRGLLRTDGSRTPLDLFFTC